MFTAFLFITVFCFYCCIYNGIQRSKIATVATDSDSHTLVTTAKPKLVLPTLTEAPQQSESVNFAVAPPAPKFTEQLASTIAPTDYSAAIKERDPVLEQIAALKLRDARIVAKLLGIAQKVNGKDKSLDWLQREIRQKLMSDRAAVVEALQQLKAS